jgi:hypothetical protein
MDGFLQIFSKDLVLLNEFNFYPYKCVEVFLVNDEVCAVSMSKFSRKPRQRDYVAFVDLKKQEIISKVETKGS